MKFFKKLTAISLLAFATQGFAEGSIVSGTSATGKANEVINVPKDALSSDDPSFKVQVVAIRELNEFATTGLAISAKFWPKLRIVCDGVVKDESTGIVLKPITRLRIAVSANVTGCSTVTIEKPADAEGVTFSDAASKIEWYAIGLM